MARKKKEEMYEETWEEHEQYLRRFEQFTYIEGMRVKKSVLEDIPKFEGRCVEVCEYILRFQSTINEAFAAVEKVNTAYYIPPELWNIKKLKERDDYINYYYYSDGGIGSGCIKPSSDDFPKLLRKDAVKAGKLYHEMEDRRSTLYRRKGMFARVFGCMCEEYIRKHILPKDLGYLNTVVKMNINSRTYLFMLHYSNPYYYRIEHLWDIGGKEIIELNPEVYREV